MKRITGRMRQPHCDYYKARQALSKAIMTWGTDEEDAVDAALKDGTLNDHKHSATEIQELKDTGKWKTRYRDFIQTRTHALPELRRRMRAWLDADWLEKEDPDFNNCKLGYADARRVALEQIHKAHFFG